MRYGRTVLLLVCLSLTGAYLSLMAQERREPWPPRPVVPPDSEEQGEPPRPSPKLPPPAPIDLGPAAGKPEAPLPLPAPTPLAPTPATPPRIELPKVDLSGAPTLPAPIELPPPAPPPSASPTTAPALPPARAETPKPAPAPASTPEMPPPGPPPAKAETPRSVPVPVKTVELPPPAPAQFETPPVALPTPAAPTTPKATVPVPAPMATPSLPPANDRGLPLPPPAPVRQDEEPAPRPMVKIVAPPPGEIKDQTLVAPAPSAPITSAPAKPVPETLQPFRLVNPVRKTAAATPAPLPPMTPGTPPVPLPETSLVHSSPIAVSTGAGIVIEKRGPAHAKHTDPIAYTVIVRNPTAAPITHVRVEDEVPTSTRLLACDPEPVVQGSRLIWTLAALAPGEERQFRVAVQASIPGEINSTARVFTPAAHSQAKTQVHPGALPSGSGSGPVPASAVQSLQVLVKAPPTAAPGASVLFEITIQNTAAMPLGKTVVQVKMSEGLGHPEGREIDAELKGIAAGGRESLKLPLRALKVGPQTLDVLIQSADGQKASHRATVMIGESALRVRPLDASKLMARQDAEVGVEVANYQAHPVRNLLVSQSVPEGIEFISAADRGVFREEARTVQWLVDYLAPGEARTLRMKVQGKQPGEFKHDILVRSDVREEAKTSGVLHVEGRIDLSLEISNTDKALELGKETTYELLVQNHGSMVATGVQVTAQVPDGMAAQRASGPVPFRVEGRQLVFEPLSRLSPNEKHRYVIGLTGQVAGQQRLRVQVASDQASVALAREHTLLVYRDN